MVFQLSAIVCFGTIAYQDIKDRMVYAFLFPLLGVFLAVTFYQNTTTQLFWYYSFMNLLLVGTILLILWCYTRFILQKAFLNASLGLGDVLLFLALAFGFPTITFLIALSFSFVFSLLLYLTFKYKAGMETVPLAGFISLFFVMLMVGSFLLPTIELYRL